MTVLINSMGAFAFGAAPSLTEQFIWGAALPLPLAVRRRFPLAVLIVVGVLFIAAQARQIGDNLVPSIVAVPRRLHRGGVGAEPDGRALVAARRDRRDVRLARVSASSATCRADRRTSTTPPGRSTRCSPSVLYNLVLNVAVLPRRVRVRQHGLAFRAAAGRAEHSAEQLRESQEQNTRGAIVAERVRIARDLHDVVAHHVSVMGVQAGAARRALDKDPALARTALQTVEQTARTAIGELRGLLGVLRAEDGRASNRSSGRPGWTSVPELVTSARSAGLEVRHGVYGEPRPVPDAIGLSAYRVVQEALTNVVKHAGAHSAEVRVRYLDSALEVEVTDDGRGGPGTAERRVRAASACGSGSRCTAASWRPGHAADTGYRVRASLPVPTVQGGGA